jgi:DNA-cytosine methyltransferase
MRFIDLCAGIGGGRAGFSNIGWECKLSLEIDPCAVAVHRLAFGDCMELDVRNLDVEAVPPYDVLAAGFPCQPFSSSGSKTGFKHRSGNVFQDIMKIVAQTKPQLIILENVGGLLRNQHGYSMACILAALTEASYQVEWLTLDASWLGIMQTRARVFIIAYQTEGSNNEQRVDLAGRPYLNFNFNENGIFKELMAEVGVKAVNGSNGLLSEVIDERRPQVGKRKPTTSTPFGSAGIAAGNLFSTFNTKKPEQEYEGLGQICAPNFTRSDEIRSVRYYARGGPTKPTFRTDPIAHCMGTNIGAAPTFGIPLESILDAADEAKVLEFSNWSRRQEGHLVFRLTPERAMLLFGPGTSTIIEALAGSSVTKTKKYVLIGNIIAPLVASKIGTLVEKFLHQKNQKASTQ